MRILLADDHRMLREGLRAVLERESLQVVGEASSGREVLSLCGSLQPDVLIMDVHMPELNGIEATRQVRALAPASRVIGLSMSGERSIILAMFAAGASGYLLKSAAAEELVRAIREVAGGRKYVSPAIAGVIVDYVVESASGPQLAGKGVNLADGCGLTAREREVLQLVAEGNASKDIAKKLNLAVTTVETHRRQIMEKLGIHTVAELTKFAVRAGITPLE